jgi:fatty-acyl-CoA synthase
MNAPEMSFDPPPPTAFLDRAGAAHGDQVAVIDGTLRWTYAELHDRSSRLAGGPAPLAPNSHVMLEAHFGVPWSGAPLLTLNTRLSAPEIAYILGHAKAAVLLHDPVFDDLVDASLTSCPSRRCGSAPARSTKPCSPPPNR